MYEHTYKNSIEIPGLENWLYNTIGYMICLITNTFHTIFCFVIFFIVGKKGKKFPFQPDKSCLYTHLISTV